MFDCLKNDIEAKRDKTSFEPDISTEKTIINEINSL